MLGLYPQVSSVVGLMVRVRGLAFSRYRTSVSGGSPGDSTRGAASRPFELTKLAGGFVCSGGVL